MPALQACFTSLLYKPALSSSKFKDIMPQTQIFCVFPTAMDLALNYLAKFVAGGKGYVTRQQLWIGNVVRTIENQTGFTCVCLDK